MADRGLDVLEKYDFEVKRTYKGRGVIMVDTDKGPRVLKNYIGSGRHLEWCAPVLEKLNESGVINVDAYEKNKDGCYVTESETGGRYVLKRWYPCRDCDIKFYEDIMSAVRNLAFLHKELMECEAEKQYTERPIREEYARKGRELARIKKYLGTIYEKNKFEMMASKSFGEFIPEVESSINFADDFFSGNHIEQKLCHGNFNYHNIGYGDTLGVIGNFEKMCYGFQLKDLYTFMRKILEKNNWDIKIGYGMFAEYDRIIRLNSEKMELLYIFFAFPEKYWKLMNGYYNARKSFFPVKNLEKLEKLIEMNSARKNFISTIH